MCVYIYVHAHRVYMCVCIYIYVHAHRVYVCESIHLRIYTQSLHVYVYMFPLDEGDFLCVYTYAYVCGYIYVSVTTLHS